MGAHPAGMTRTFFGRGVVTSAYSTILAWLGDEPGCFMFLSYHSYRSDQDGSRVQRKRRTL